ncbi:YgiT-type zinc finger protein [Phormidesmis priestleyi ULC007]|uniref:YgiT-type zinc finger protein n=1 Tax=Phormidesmis priestleyi ULC007 TaxID=1920490 RepID=A0A2T1DIQ2_9CYAN|nr:YgiT-type zinc finger protein [Phormidesmis priestleyi]PSB20356.1 YgiT-type zinc finger protein [Phormidesmis priestleyi ULC007]PZO47060.1 MAG: YgiT-type zinc finger protein [Phormidesmis priestleyi]
MFHCHVCSSNQAHPEHVDEVFLIDGKPILVEGIPAQVCSRCQELTFSRETTEKIRRMLHGEAEPIKSMSIEVLAFR